MWEERQVPRVSVQLGNYLIIEKSHLKKRNLFKSRKAFLKAYLSLSLMDKLQVSSLKFPSV